MVKIIVSTYNVGTQAVKKGLYLRFMLQLFIDLKQYTVERDTIRTYIFVYPLNIDCLHRILIVMRT